MLDRLEFPRQVGSLNSCSDVKKENCRNTNVDHIFGYIPVKFIVRILPFCEAETKQLRHMMKPWTLSLLSKQKIKSC